MSPKLRHQNDVPKTSIFKPLAKCWLRPRVKYWKFVDITLMGVGMDFHTWYKYSR